MKKIFLLFFLPIVLQLVVFPFWFVVVDYRYIDASIASIFMSLLTPIYLFVINIKKRIYNIGIIKIHTLMLFVILSTILIGYLGWSKFDFQKFFHPDPMTKGFEVFFVEFGVGVTLISIVVSRLIKNTGDG